MTHSLEDLISGKLIGLKRLKLADGLTEFPKEILSLADSLEILDLSDNDLSELPENISQLKKLKIIFFANNKFTRFPEVLKACPSLTMIGFKSNQIEVVDENVFPPLLRWLILTDNKIKKLPKSIGEVTLLQKCALAGNQIEELPVEMANCKNLELLRISANHLKEIPKWLFELPRLSWVAFGGNPASHQIKVKSDLELFDWKDFKLKDLLGEGASGVISQATWNSKQEEVAIKVFKGDVTSDGLPEDEMNASIIAGFHENLIQVKASIKNHPENKSGLVMKLIPSDYVNLGNPPSLESCTRDVFDEGVNFNALELLKMAKGMASVSAHLHRKGLNHGDLYAHNIMVNEKADTLFGDFGATSFYDVNSETANNIEKVEVRAFGCLIEDLLGLVSDQEMNTNLQDKWIKLIENCTKPEVSLRFSFSEIEKELSQY